MNIIDAYGDFDLPEEKSVVEVVEDPVKVVLASYYIFKKRIEKNLEDDLWYCFRRETEQVYQEALKVLEEKQNLKYNYKQMEENIDKLRKKAKKHDGTGIFLSALINSTKINYLFIDKFPELDQISYKLKKDKLIILGPENTSYEMGLMAEEESTTINLGEITHHGTYATGGNHINQGIIRYLQGYCATGGNHINQGTTTDLGLDAQKGKYINLKTLKRKKQSSVIDLSQKQGMLITQLEQKLAELDFLKTNKSLKLMKLVNAYDWKKFNKELNGICEAINTVYTR